MTTTNQELSKNGILPKLTLAPKPTGPAVVPRLIGAKTIAEVQEAKERAAEQVAKFGVSLEEWNNGKQWFDPKTQDCEGKRPNVSLSPPSGIDVTGKLFCSGKVFSREGGTVYNTKNAPQKIVERHAMHPSLTAFTSTAGHHGAALTHGGPQALAKTVQKVGGETLNMSKALLGIKGK